MMTCVWEDGVHCVYVGCLLICLVVLCVHRCVCAFVCVVLCVCIVCAGGYVVVVGAVSVLCVRKWASGVCYVRCCVCCVCYLALAGLREPSALEDRIPVAASMTCARGFDNSEFLSSKRSIVDPSRIHYLANNSGF